MGEISSSGGSASVFNAFIANASGARIHTESQIANAVRILHPNHSLNIANAGSANFLAYAEAGHATATIINGDQALITRRYCAPARRYTGEGKLTDVVKFAGYDFTFKGDQKHMIYIVEGRDGLQGITNDVFILTDKELSKTVDVDEMVKTIAEWTAALHSEILVFDQGWMKNKELWKSVQKSNWEDVVLGEDKKKAVIADVEGFFESEETYNEFAVPWKRGIIFHGPPGNGKTVSIKALMHSLSARTNPSVETLYVKTFNSPREIQSIFVRARQIAPCLLIFEDIDSLVTDSVRSYFLNEVDGLESNHGILMIGSTNHLDRLDPGIAKRPSRFDRKYFFDLPDESERTQYCEYWRHKLAENKKVDFPEALSGKIAEITNDFSFAYMKEAFIASLMVIVGGGGQEEQEGENLDDNLLWNVIRRQVATLRDEMEKGQTATEEA